MEYSIGEVAEKMGITASTLRYYDKEGLLPTVSRSSGGIRVFNDEDISWIHLLGCLKATGMPIKDIKKFCDWAQMGDKSLKQRQQLFHERETVIEEQLANLQKTLALVKFKCWYYDTAVKAGTEKVPQEMIKKGL